MDRVLKYSGDYELGYAHVGDAGLDLRITEDVSVPPKLTETVGTGIRVAIPKGHVGLLFPRSGLASRKGINLANCVGVIDSGYRGEVKVPLHNNTVNWVDLSKGDRVCQLVVVPFATCSLMHVESLNDTERGEDGFGSTGVE